MPASPRGEALVCIMNNLRDWKILREQLWYRVPVETAPRRWPPKWLALYQTKVFGAEAHAINYYAKVKRIDRVFRPALFPHEGQHAKSTREYYQVHIESLEKLPKPVPSLRMRLIVYIPTTIGRLMTAEELNDLYDESPLEDALWAEMKRLEIRAERQYYLRHKGESFALDFALFCKNGNVDVETDGDTWHSDPERIPQDNRRNNAMAALGYKVLRFSTMQVREQIADYCVPNIVETVNRLGGLEEAPRPAHTYYRTSGGIVWQMALFERRAAYNADEKCRDNTGSDPESSASPLGPA